MAKRETPAFVCPCVFRHERPVLHVSHAGGDWQFLCGHPHESESLPHVVGLNHLIDHDPSLTAILDLPCDSDAERSTPAGPWRYLPSPPDDE